MMTMIYVYLQAEGVDVWRPVSAKCVSDREFIIDSRAEVPAGERWAFQPGDHVVCEWRQFADGKGLAAIRLAK